MILAQMAGEGSGDVEVHQVHRAAQQIAKTGADPVKHGGGKARHGDIDVGAGAQAVPCRGAEEIDFARSSRPEFTGGAGNQFL